MAVQPQTPYIEHIANDTTTGFNLGFDCDDQDHLIVKVDDVEPSVGSWSLTGGAVVFGAAPTSGRKITVQRNTPFERKRDYQSYDNSFRPPVVNKDFDWIWLKLQELGVADWILGSRLDALKGYVDKKDNQLQENIDNLKGYVDLKDDELRAYLMEEIRKQGVALDQLDDYYNYLMQRLAQIAVDKGWDASFVTTASNQNQQEINDFGGAKWYSKVGGYELGATVKLDSGDTVQSTAPKNTANPNTNMAGWLNLSSATTVATTADLIADIGYKDGQEIYAQSRTAGRHKGGGRFYFDSNRVGENDGVTVFNGWVRSKSEQLKPEWAGAIGDGIADDSSAFRLINSVGFYKALRKPSNALFKENGYTISLDPNAKYRLVGSDLMGSPLGLDTTEELKRIQMRIEGNGSTIFFDPQNEFDHLFNIDAFIDTPVIKDLEIYPRRTSAAMPIGMGVIFNLVSGYNGKSGAGNLEIDRVYVETMRYGVDQITSRARRMFQIKGTTQADQIRIKNSKFSYFKEMYYSENPESVNNVFENCAFFAGGTYAATANIRYFNVSQFYDGLTIKNCNATLYSEETVFYGRAPLNNDGTVINASPQNRVQFQDVRWEFQGTGDVVMWDSNAWTGVFTGSNFRLAAGSATVKLVFKPFESSALDFERVNFNKVKILAPITSSKSYSGAGLAWGVVGRLCEFNRAETEFGVFDGANEFNIKNALVNKRKFKQMMFDSSSYINANNIFDFQISPDNETYSSSRKSSRISFSKNGVAMGESFVIPPYQTIEEVYLNMRSVMPSTYAGFRAWFGEKSDNKYFDVPNYSADTEVKASLKLFDGRAAIFNSNLQAQKITVDALDSSGNIITSGTLSELVVVYKAVSTNSLNITMEADSTYMYNSNKTQGTGTTAQRPLFGLYLGMPYFDRTLGKPIYCKQVSPTVWGDATGATV